MQPVAVLIQVTPIIAYAPAFVIWLGPGLKPILAITTLVCFVPFLFNAVTGLRSVDPATHELLRSVDANGREIFWRLRLPHALPYLFAAARIAVGLALDRRRARRVVRARVRRARRGHPQGPQLQRRRPAVGAASSRSASWAGSRCSCSACSNGSSCTGTRRRSRSDA